MGRKLGDPHDPLLVSVRSGAKFSMPGMMDTVLNLGLNDRSVKGLAKVTSDERFAYDSYRRFISMYGRIVLGLDGEPFDEELEEAKRHAGATTDADVPPAGLKELCELYKAIVKARVRAGRSRRIRAASCGAPSRPCSRAGTAPGPSPTGCGSASATTWARRSTSRRWCSATVTTTRGPAWASPATPPPARTGPTATSWSTPRARTWWPASGTPRTSTPWRGSSRPSTPSCWRSSPGSRSTTGTCATRSSPSTRASSGCCRPGWASAPAPPRCAWPST